ncbi:SWI SNF, matrix associated, actin dependent regulator of chromatin, sub c, member 2 [Rhizophlyctis rosea]|nr:SWI SNF, matrix associated, actin dependent regulator of chromatin, sub c, member 2 [Rhizophlyctis rosea]
MASLPQPTSPTTQPTAAATPTAPTKEKATGFRYYKHPVVLAAFAPLAEKLSEELSQEYNVQQLQQFITIPIPAKELAAFTQSIQHFQADLFSKPPSQATAALTRVPTKLFKDLSQDGSLYVILKAAYDVRVEFGWRRWDLTNAGKKGKHVELLTRISEALMTAGLLANPCIAFASSVDEDLRTEFTAVAYKLKATVVPYMKPEVTHVIQQNFVDAHEDEGGDQEWYRSLEKLGGFCLLHYWYKPDSADVWVPESSGDYMDPEVRMAEEVKRNGGNEREKDAVGCRPQNMKDPGMYRRDGFATVPSFRNGWYNEEDYEVEEPEFPEAQPESEDASDEASQEDEDESDQEEEEENSVSIAELDDRSSVAPTEDGLEVGMEDAQLRDGPIPVPLVEVVDLSRRITKSKKSEYEPFDVTVFHNISYTRPNTRTILLPPDEKSETERRTAVKDLPLRQSNFQEKEETSPELKPHTFVDHFDTHYPDWNEGDEQDGVTNMETDAIKTEPDPTSSSTNDNPPPSNSLLFQPTTLTLPPTASWFTLDAIHETERLAFPDMYSPESVDFTESDYVRVRNFMVTLYQLDTGLYLTVGECYRHLECDVYDLLRVHQCLERWGVINFAVYEHHSLPLTTFDYHTITSSPTPISAITTTPEPLIYDPVTTPSPLTKSCPSCTQPYGKTRYVHTRIAEFELCDECFVEGRYPFDFVGRDFVRVESLVGCKRKRVERFVRGEGGVCVKRERVGGEVGVDGGEEVGRDVEGGGEGEDGGGEGGVMEEGLHGADAEKSDGNGAKNEDGKPDSSWTDEEVLRLLEGVEMYGGVKQDVDIMVVDDGPEGDVKPGTQDGDDGEIAEWDWEGVSRHVGTKGARECLVRFAGMELEGVNGEGGDEEGEGGLLDQTPFGGAKNPVMSLVKFLGSVVTPGVAGAAAEGGLRVLVGEGGVGSDGLGPVALDGVVAPTNGSTEIKNDTTSNVDGTNKEPTSSPPTTPPTIPPTPLTTPIPPTHLRQAAETAFRAAVAKAEELAMIEERQVEVLVRLLVEAQVRKVEGVMGMLDGAVGKDEDGGKVVVGGGEGEKGGGGEGNGNGGVGGV